MKDMPRCHIFLIQAFANLHQVQLPFLGLNNRITAMTERQLQLAYDEHADSVFAYALQLTRNEADACDVTQSVFLKLCSQPESCAGVEDPRSFLLRMTRNRVIDLFRQRDSAKRTHFNFVESTDSVFEAASTVDEMEFRLRLSQALQALPEDQRAVAHLRLWEKKTFEEISEILEIPINTAASRYRYGLEKLPISLKAFYEEIR